MFDFVNVKTDTAQIFINSFNIWKRTFAAIISMPLAACETFIFLIIAGFFYFYLWYILQHYGVLQPWGVAVYLVYFAQMALDAILFAPWALAVERFLVFGERAAHFLDRRQPSRLLEFAKLRVIVTLIEAASQLVILLVTRYGSREIILAAFICLVPIAWFLYRFYLLLPAIAVGANGATFTNAHSDAKGSFWLSMVFIAITLSPLLVVIFKMPSLNLGLAEGWTTFAKIGVFRAGVETLWITLANAACAQLYLLHSQALGRPRNLPPTLLNIFE